MTTQKTVLITGTSSGMGRAAAFLFQKNGWNVVATMRTPAKETELNKLPNVICPALDVNDKATIESALAEALKQFGQIDVVVNNAGYGLMGAFETLSAEQIRRQFDTNVFGMMEVTRAILPHFRRRNAGLVINVASMVGRVPLPLYSVYNSSKFAVEGFSEGLTYELEQFNVRVKLIEPGAVKTDFFGRSSDRINNIGETAYQTYSDEQFAVMDGIGASGSTSEDAAGVIFRAASDGSRRLRYSVGIDAKAILAARSLLPNRVFRAMIKLSLSPAAYNSVGRLLYKQPE